MRILWASMLLLLPGLICDARIYAPQIAAFAGARAVDGYGLADTLQAMAWKTLDFADAEGAETFDLLGHSMGGRVALEVVRLAPGRVRRLALISTGVHSPREDEPAKRAALQAIGHERGFEALVDTWLPPMVAAANRADAAIHAPLREMCLEAGQAVFDAHVRALLGRPEQESLLPGIACPTLVLTGALDAWSPPAQHAEIAAAIPDADLVIVPGAGHMIQREAPDALNDAIAAWRARPA
jgi:pimeloyl-ACP methyl ester carboxylesterase